MLSKIESLACRTSLDDMIVARIKSAENLLSSFGKPDMVDFEDFLKQCTEAQQILGMMGEDMSKLSPIGYEDSAICILEALKVVADIVRAGDGQLWWRIHIGMVDAMKKVNTAIGAQDDIRGECEERDKIASHLRRQVALLSSTLPSWMATWRSTARSSQNFMEKMLRPVAKDTFDSFEPILKSIKFSNEHCKKGEEAREMVLKSAAALASVCCSPDKSRAMPALLDSWTAWRSDPEKHDAKEQPFVENLLTIGVGKQEALARTTALHDTGEALITLVLSGSATQSVLHCFIDSNLTGAIAELEATCDPGMFGNIEAPAWRATDPNGAPRLDGMFASVGGGNLATFMEKKGVDASQAPFDADRLLTKQTLSLIEIFVDTFQIKSLTVPSLNSNRALAADVALVHMTLKAQAMTMGFCVLFAQKLCVEGGLGKLITIESSKGAAIVWRRDEMCVCAMASLASHIEQTRSFLASETLSENQAVSHVQTNISIGMVRNFCEMGLKYMKALQIYIVKNSLVPVANEAGKLKEMCPPTSGWASQSHFQNDGLVKFLKATDPLKLKTLIKNVYDGIVLVSGLAKDIGAPNVWQSDEVSGSMSACRANLQFGKDTLAIRSVAALIVADPEHMKHDHIARVIEAAKRMSSAIPESIVLAAEGLQTT